VIAELRDVSHVEATQILVVRNVGPSVAENVAVSFEPFLGPVDEQAVGSAALANFVRRRYETPFAMLAPGAELDNVYYSAEPGDGTGYANDIPFPERVRVHVEYDGPDGYHYKSDFGLDVGLIRQRTYALSPTPPQRLAERNTAALEVVAAAARTIASRRS
jgi:hypothetical protein